MLPGRGVCARIDGKCILEGKAALLLEHGVEMTMPGEAGDYIDRGCTATYVAAEGEFIGFLALSDTLREESAATIKLNMTLSMTLNFVAITLAIIGTLNPVVGALVHNAGSVLVITNSALPSVLSAQSWRLCAQCCCLCEYAIE